MQTPLPYFQDIYSWKIIDWSLAGKRYLEAATDKNQSFAMIVTPDFPLNRVLIFTEKEGFKELFVRYNYAHWENFCKKQWDNYLAKHILLRIK